MRRHNERMLGDIIREVIHRYRLDGKLTETRIMQAWGRVMGSGILHYTSNVSFSKGTLKVYLRSAVLREELSMGKCRMIDMINKELGEESVQDIIFL